MSLNTSGKEYLPLRKIDWACGFAFGFEGVSNIEEYDDDCSSAPGSPLPASNGLPLLSGEESNRIIRRVATLPASGDDDPGPKGLSTDEG